MIEPPVIRSSDKTHVLAIWRGHVLGLWNGRASVYGAERFEELLIEAAEAKPGRTIYIAVLPTSVELPDAEVRNIFVRVGRRLERQVCCVAVVIEGDGFQAAALRGMVTGIAMLATARYPIRCFSTLMDAVLWAEGELGRASGKLGRPAEVAEAIDAMRANLR